MAKFTVSTKPNKGSEAINTIVEVETDSASREVLVALALQSAIIKRQAYWRKHGIPATDSFSLKDYAPGTRHAAPAQMSKEDIAAKAKSDPEFRKQLLEMLEQ